MTNKYINSSGQNLVNSGAFDLQSVNVPNFAEMRQQQIQSQQQ